MSLCAHAALTLAHHSTTTIGYLEDFLLEEELYSGLDANFTGGSNDVDQGRDEDEEDAEGEFSSYSSTTRLSHGRGRGKRQAGFPGQDTKTDTSKWGKLHHYYLILVQLLHHGRLGFAGWTRANLERR